MQFTMCVDPGSRDRAYATIHGVQSSFINRGGDMYAMALRYASYATDGAVVYVRGGAEEHPVKRWNGLRELERARRME
jgi:hypothetical protein